MEKGLFIIIALGVGIIYLATVVFDDSSSGYDSSWFSTTSSKNYDKYYQKDSLGDSVLNLNSLSLKNAKSLWPTLPTSSKLADDIPNFDLMKADAINAMVEGNFKRYMLEYIEKVHGKFLAGEIDSDKAKKMIKSLKQP